MRILANGNVGINTTTPTALLHTVGSLRFQNLIDASSPFRLLGVDSNGNVYRYSPSDFGGGSVSDFDWRSEEHTSELQSRPHLVCRLLLEKKKIKTKLL